MNDGMKYCWPPVCRMSAHTRVTSPPQICAIAAWRAARFAWSLMMGSRRAAHAGTRVTVFVGSACSYIGVNGVVARRERRIPAGMRVPADGSDAGRCRYGEI